jgi:hypothetical protein
MIKGAEYMEKELRVCPEDKLVAYCEGECDNCKRKESNFSDNENFPPFVYPIKRLYEEKTDATTANFEEENKPEEKTPNYFSKEWAKVKESMSQSRAASSEDSNIIRDLPPNVVTRSLESAVDYVNRPPHYTSGRYEVIDVIKDKLSIEQYYGFLCGNILKYMMRWQNKNGLEDLKKARWYLTKLIEEKEKGNEEEEKGK